MQNKERGFEYAYERLEQSTFPVDLRRVFEPDTVCVKLSVPAGSPSDRIASALMAASVLAKSTEGMMWRDTGFVEADDPVEWVRAWISSSSGDAARPNQPGPMAAASSDRGNEKALPQFGGAFALSNTLTQETTA